MSNYRFDETTTLADLAALESRAGQARRLAREDIWRMVHTAGPVVPADAPEARLVAAPNGSVRLVSIEAWRAVQKLALQEERWEPQVVAVSSDAVRLEVLSCIADYPDHTARPLSASVTVTKPGDTGA